MCFIYTISWKIDNDFTSASDEYSRLLLHNLIWRIHLLKTRLSTKIDGKPSIISSLSILSFVSSNNNYDDNQSGPLQILSSAGSVEEKQRKLNEMILQIQMMKEHLLINQSDRVSEKNHYWFIIFLPLFISNCFKVVQCWVATRFVMKFTAKFLI